jgi:beta-lactamase superfamily II metal-dependent hydrolase
MIIFIKTYPAKNGDCFLVSLAKEDASRKHFLIDCGYIDTFEKYLKKDLIEIGEKNESIERMILTHIDADHISGALKFLKDNNSERFVEIKEIWHNTFRHLFKKNQIEIDKKQERILKQIIQRGYSIEKVDKKGEYEISAKQGTTLGALILQGQYSWNSDFYENAVCINSQREIIVDQEIKLFLLSPNEEKLEKLKNFWKNELDKYGINYNSSSGSVLYDDAFEMTMSWEREKTKKHPKTISATKETVEDLLQHPFEEDTTATNGSSISFILQIQEKKLLFLADAHPDLITQSLKEYQKDDIIIFDFIKVSHHGSFSNISKELLEKIDAHIYLISTNGGKHNHPDKETIAHIISRPANFHRKIYFNYITNTSTYFDRDDWKERYNHSINYLNQPPYTLSL